ncbi:uncharacterized protein LOC126734938 isoform X2 [Anthonomus grandis grandis]|uniref:uncharacterized protein LOC126734938 isoform X2 n=1 Tax=Anthonomus grandis grandis TaxID=2921223 RepID=UPI002165B90D|nr:uncharacterized protein LOC126734938 isoform X2 [Anthonomus grandis grandis]XP_050294746.1 uncharacterized protein LOC126734938 isoform X2 [Anthonomus grandis grandis]XP_050294747.1 uncharacterized protein LOC126734938 isoform X2 [Anthonomus grandis grandis]
MDEYSTTDNLHLTNFTMEDELEKEIRIMEHDFDYYHNIYVFVTEYFISLAFVIETILVLSSTCLMSFLIYKFKRLRTRTNYILVNFMVSSTICSLLVLCGCIIETFQSYFFTTYYYEEYVYCILILATIMSVNAMLLLALILAIDWLMSANYSNVLPKYQQWYHFVIIGIYTFASKDFLLFFVINNEMLLHIIIELLCTGLVLIITGITVTVLFVIKKCNRYSPEQSKIDYALVISCTFFLMWLPVIFTSISAIIVSSASHPMFYKYSIILIIITQVLSIFGLASPFIYIILLCKLDQNFKACYDYIFKKSLRNYTQYECDEDPESV